MVGSGSWGTTPTALLWPPHTTHTGTHHIYLPKHGEKEGERRRGRGRGEEIVERGREEGREREKESEREREAHDTKLRRTQVVLACLQRSPCGWLLLRACIKSLTPCL